MTPCLDEHLALPGCTGVAERGSSRCHPCNVRREATRRPSGGRRYPADWQRASKAAIQRQPYCSRCGTTGTTENPLTGEHVVPRVSGGTHRQGIVVLCRRCNSAGAAKIRARR